MNANSLGVDLIVVPVDFSDVTGKVIDTAVQYAGTFGSRILLMHAIEPEVPLITYETAPLPVLPQEVMSTHEEEQDQRRQLELLRDQVAAAGVPVSIEQFTGRRIEDKIVERAKREKAGLIIMGSHGHGAVYNLLVGSVATGVLKAALCPVLIVPRAAG